MRCIGGFEVVKDFNNNVGGSWFQAKAYCEDKGGRLAIVNSQADNEEIASQTSAKGATDVWLGGTDSASEGSWEWAHTGISFTSSPYTNWNPGEPNDLGGNEDCMEMRLSANDGQNEWNDNDCVRDDRSRAVACEFDSPLSPVRSARTRIR